MKTINLQHKIQVKIENKISKYAFIRQNILNKMNFFFKPQKSSNAKKYTTTFIWYVPSMPIEGREDDFSIKEYLI